MSTTSNNISLSTSPALPTTTALRTQAAYVCWADNRCIEACATVEEATYLGKDHGFSFRTLHDTLLHMMSAQHIWLCRFQGNLAAQRLTRAEVPNLPALRALWPKLHDDFATFVDSGPDVLRPLTWTAFDGNTHTLELGHLLSHVLDHATLHRGQLNSMLKLSGATPPAVMFYNYVVSTRA